MTRINGSLSPLAPPVEGRRLKELPESVRPRQDAVAVRTAPAKRNRDEVDPQVRAAAEGMEAMFVNQMMQAMRKTVHKSEMSLDSPATEIYQSMLDAEVSQKTARSNSIGLADQIIAYLEARSYNGSQGPSNEGRPEVRSLSAADTVKPKTSVGSDPAVGFETVQEVPSDARE